MTGEAASLLQTLGWYVVARDGDLVLRVRPGVHIGEDRAGELSFEPANAEVDFEVTDDGRLIVRAHAGHELETETGERTASVDFGRDSPVQVRLTDQVLLLATDFDGAAPSADPKWVQAVLAAPPQPAEPAPAHPRTEPFLRAEPAPARVPHEVAGSLANARWRDRRLLVPAAAVAAASALLLTVALVNLPEDRSPVVTQVATEPPDSTRAPATDQTASSNKVAVTDPTLPFRQMPATDRTPTSSRTRGTDQTLVPGPVQPLPQDPQTSTAGPNVAEALNGISALLDNEPAPGPAALNVAEQSVKALLAAYPDDPRIRSELERLSERIAQHATLASQAGGDGAAKAAAAQAAGTEVAGAAAQPEPDALEIEPVSVPPILRRVAPDTADTVAATTEPEIEPAASARSTEFATLSARSDAEGPEVPDAPNEQDMRLAAMALDAGRLMPPAIDNAFTLYSRMLESDPDSLIARIGLQSVRERLLARARVALASDDVGGALGMLDDAAEAGADPGEIAPLRARAAYRQRLLDAIAGNPGSLYPIAELTALQQEPPEYPRHAPADAEGSVDILMTVTESGHVRNVDVLGNPPMYFVRAARQGVGEWRFAPVVSNGEPVAVRTSVRVTFRRDDVKAVR